jgi:hypothetical protein
VGRRGETRGASERGETEKSARTDEKGQGAGEGGGMREGTAEKSVRRKERRREGKAERCER